MYAFRPMQMFYFFRIGRRKTLYLCILVQLGSSAGLVGMWEYIGFCVLMFLLGGSLLGVYMTAYVIGKDHRKSISKLTYKPELDLYPFFTYNGIWKGNHKNIINSHNDTIIIILLLPSASLSLLQIRYFIFSNFCSSCHCWKQFSVFFLKMYTCMHTYGD